MRKHGLAAALIALATYTSAAQAQEDYQCQGTVRIVVPFVAGSATDLQARVIAGYLEPELKRTVIVENMTGADGAIAAEYVARAQPDGCTLMTLTNGLFGIEPMSGKKQPFDLLKFAPITMLARNTQFLVVVADNPAKTVRDLIANAAVRDTTYGTGNTSGRVSGALFASLAKVPIRRIPYPKGESGMMTDLLGKQVDSAFALTALGQVAGGKLRALAVMSDLRFAGLPDVPAIVELYPAFRDIALIAPHGTLAGPPGLPREIAERLSREMNVILRRPDVEARFRAIGSEPVGSTPEEHRLYLRQQAKDWPRIVSEYKLQTPAD